MSSEQLIVDSTGHEVVLSVAYFLPEYVRYTTLQIVNSDSSLDFDTTFYMVVTETSDTVSIARTMTTAGEKKAIVSIYIDNGNVISDTVRMTILGPVKGSVQNTDGKLQAPQHLHIVKTVTDSLLLLWEKVSAADYYAVYMSSQPNNGYIILNDSLTATEFTTNNAADQFYYVIAKNSTGISESSNVVSSQDMRMVLQ